MINMDKLRGKLAERRISVDSLAECMNVSRSTLYRKISNNGNAITVSEANKIVEILHLSAEEAMAIFFCRDSRINETIA